VVEESTRFAEVAVLARLGQAGGLFTYALPAQLASVTGPGSLVRVPFVSRQVQGVVVSLSDQTDLPQVKPIQELLDPVPVVTPVGLQLASWISRYYAAPMSDVLGAMLPPGLDRKTLCVLEPGAEHPEKPLREDREAVLHAVLDMGRLLEDELKKRLPDIDVAKSISWLVERQYLTRSSELSPPRVSTKKMKVASATGLGSEALEDPQQLRRAEKQRAVLELLVSAGPASVTSLTQRVPGASTVVKALEKRGLVKVDVTQVGRFPIANGKYAVTQHLNLSAAQRAALKEVNSPLNGGTRKVFLLHGVTGSGKTEVYLQAVDHALAMGKSALIMVPEISLTPQAAERFAGRFPGRVAVLHSKLSPGERLDEWQRIRHGQADVVVGARSALFAPLSNLGLVVVDEEHDPSYKQDSSPRYHGRDAATVLGRLANATVILGSATPDVVTFAAATSKKSIRLLELPDRPVWGEGGSRPMPRVEVVDMRHELKTGNRSIFSGILMEALTETLDRRHQALLFLNRRGSATAVLCRDCGYVARCPNCDVPFTYHASATKLICHRCDTRRASPRACPSCESPRIRYLGIGTQRLQEETARLFPQARVVRWDRDVTSARGAHEALLQQFAGREADILVGTQMIAKGLDFPLVTLVGVISADTGLHLPDFRAPERSFQLLTQVAGRAGRAELASRVVVQTYTPEHYAVAAAVDHDYSRFYREEMSFRQAAGYPPHARLARFVYTAENAESCRQSAMSFRKLLENAVAQDGFEGIELIGPAPCFAARVNSSYRWQIIARAGQKSGVRLAQLRDYMPRGWSIDVDPVDLL
jgi:primosomal protein N' (replication factor Y)